MKTDTDAMIYLKDYAPTPYRIERVDLDIVIGQPSVRVRSLLTITPREGTPADTPLVLDADELKLASIAIDGAPLMERDFVETPLGLTINAPPFRTFVLETEVGLAPETNVRLMGLYRSNGVWCTQCEPEGFRRITYYLDRPDILAPFKVTMTADRALAPVLLANGNPAGSGELDDGRHFAVWEDPHPKPAYLFAMVAGDLGRITGTFTTASGRQVDLAIYCEHGKQDRCRYAMDSLKRAMAWDERRFGREYDLDVFNIVAVSDFNFGAMENKGLNIFNDKLVFASPASATDADYAAIESVIAHEYFHNWTGDRITCRDWFQLCLKEGLTVYRDQEFSMDERSRAVNRIEDVRQLRATQFPEDAGPLAHPPRPDRYREINNFYTATVYEKGAEVVRMLATLLGEAGFRKGMDLYFDRHDGEATTIEAFVKVFEDANGVDLGRFITWYLQAGTPTITASDSYDPAGKAYTLRLKQETRPTPNQPEKSALVIPIRFGLIGPNGDPVGWSSVEGATVRDDLIVLDSDSAELRFTGVANRPVPSLLRGLSAPANLVTDLGQDERLFLARHDTDPFNRWQALQDAAMHLLVDAAAGTPWPERAADALAAALEDTLRSAGMDRAFKAHALGLPTEADIARTIARDVDPDRIHVVRDGLVAALVKRLEPILEETYHANAVGADYSPDARQAGERALRNTALAMLVRGQGANGARLAAQQYESASNMTDRLAALGAAVGSWTAEAPAMLGDFRTMFTADPLVFDKWLALNAAPPHDATLGRIRAVLADPGFPRNNPNRLRALVGTFAMGNMVQFARPDGAGFRFVAECVADIDTRNPQVAARLLTAFRVWPTFEQGRRREAQNALKWLQESGRLSRNTADILTRTLEG